MIDSLFMGLSLAIGQMPVPQVYNPAPPAYYQQQNGGAYYPQQSAGTYYPQQSAGMYYPANGRSMTNAAQVVNGATVYTSAPMQAPPAPPAPAAAPAATAPPAPAAPAAAPAAEPIPAPAAEPIPAPPAAKEEKKEGNGNGEKKDECNGEKKKEEKEKEEPLTGCLGQRLLEIYWRDVVKLHGKFKDHLDEKDGCKEEEKKEEEKKEECNGEKENGCNGNGEGEEEEKKRRPGILPPPFKDTPFPNEEFPMVHPIGVDLDETWPLMKAIYAANTPWSECIKESRIKAYGWIDFSANVSTSKESNLPDGFNIRANKIELDQAFLRLERVCDTVQTDHCDWGFRLDNFFGIDYRYTTAKGVWSDQFTKHNHLYGDDSIMFYGEAYVPYIGEGTLFKLGRFILLPGIEADTTIDNYMYSHGIMYLYFPYTHFGLLGTTMINKNLTIQYGFVDGSDLVLWEHGTLPTFITGVRYVNDCNTDSIYACTITNDGHQTYNNVQMMPDIVWTHVFSRRVHMLTEGYYNYINQVPAYSAFISPDGTKQTFQGFTPYYGFMNYFEVALTAKSYITIRQDYLNDLKGQRTGFKTSYFTESLGYCYKPYTWLWFRPEVRYSHSFDTTSYDQVGANNITGSVNGQKQNQFVVTFDMLFRF